MQKPQLATVNTYMCHTCKSRQHAHFEEAYIGNSKYRLLVCNGCNMPLFIISLVKEKKHEPQDNVEVALRRPTLSLTHSQIRVAEHEEEPS